MAEPDRKIFWTVAIVAAVAVGALLFWPTVQRELGPEPQRAWVAIQAEGADVAEAGTVELPAGAHFRLHAVLEARRRSGETVYYTEAPALRLAGRDVPATALVRWDRPAEVRIRWFTVEGKIPFMTLRAGQGIDRFGFEGFFRPEWGESWSVSGTLEPANDARLVKEDRQGRLPFGTQRYQARIELYADEGDEIPSERFVSPGAAELAGDPDALPTAVLTLAGAAAPASAVFGLTEIEPPPDAGPEIADELVRLTRSGLAFGRLALLREVLAAAAVGSPGELVWQRLDLDAGAPWQTTDGEAADEPAVAQGDLLRVGERWVVLYRDGGDPGAGAGKGAGNGAGDGRLDRGDLCFDYARGSVVRPLGAVFAGGGEVEWARLRAPEPTPGEHE